MKPKDFFSIRNNFDFLKVYNRKTCTSFKYGERSLSLFLKSIENSYLSEFITKESLTLNSVFSERDMTCNSSFTIGLHNFLLFNDNDESCFIIQQFGLIDAIYFPNDNVLLQFLGGPNFKNCIFKFLNFIKKSNLNEIKEYVKKKCTPNYLIGHTRPYHFFYDQLPAIELVESALKEKQLNLITKRHWDFIGLNNLFHDIKTKYLEDIEKEKIKDSTFSIRLCIRKNKTPISIYNKLDRRIRKNTHVMDLERQKKIAEVKASKKDRFIVLWFGITGQKRSWVSQIDGIVKISEHFNNETNGKIKILIDGWTSTYYHKKDSVNSEDNDIFNEIEKRLKLHDIKKENIISTISWNSSEKIEIAQYVDSFLTNHATGSLHISRIANKAGVTHLNTKMNKNQYIHHNVFEVENIVDLEYSNESMNQNYDFDFIDVINPMKDCIKINSGH